MLENALGSDGPAQPPVIAVEEQRVRLCVSHTEPGLVTIA